MTDNGGREAALPRGEAALKAATQQIMWGVVRGSVAGVTGMRGLVMSLGFVEQTPPDTIIKECTVREVGAS